jgi:hypothetical protein
LCKEEKKMQRIMRMTKVRLSDVVLTCRVCNCPSIAKRNAAGKITEQSWKCPLGCEFPEKKGGMAYNGAVNKFVLYPPKNQDEEW